MKFRKKPVVIEAYQFTRQMIEEYLFDGVPLPIGVKFGQASFHPGNRTIDHYTVRVDTLEGETYKVEEGDWIITGVAGERYPCKPDIFLATYDPVE